MEVRVRYGSLPGDAADMVASTLLIWDGLASMTTAVTASRSRSAARRRMIWHPLPFQDTSVGATGGMRPAAGSMG